MDIYLEGGRHNIQPVQEGSIEGLAGGSNHKLSTMGGWEVVSALML